MFSLKLTTPRYTEATLPSALSNSASQRFPKSPSLSFSRWRFGQTRKLGQTEPNRLRAIRDDNSEMEKFTVENADVSKELEEILNSEESNSLLKDLAAAEERVMKAKREMEDLNRLETEVQRAKLELRRIEEIEKKMDDADDEVTQLESLVQEAEAEFRLAGKALIEARAGQTFDSPTRKWNNVSDDFNEDMERIESGKAGAISGFVGSVTALPFIFVSNTEFLNDQIAAVDSTVQLAIIAVTCGLFGVTYRYIVRKDMGNLQLKGGAVGAFGLTRGLAQIGTTFTNVSSPDSFADLAPSLLTAALSAGESVLIVLFCALALDFCMQKSFLKTFPPQ